MTKLSFRGNFQSVRGFLFNRQPKWETFQWCVLGKILMVESLGRINGCGHEIGMIKFIIFIVWPKYELFWRRFDPEVHLLVAADHSIPKIGGISILTEVYTLQCVWTLNHDPYDPKRFCWQNYNFDIFQESLTEATSMLVTDVANE